MSKKASNAKRELGLLRTSELYQTLFPAQLSNEGVNDFGAILVEHASGLEADFTSGSPLPYFLDAQSKALFSKSAILPSHKKELETKAIEKWKVAENRCLSMNQRFRDYWKTGKWVGPAGDLLPGIARRVADMMGIAPSSIFALKGRHGPGSTVSLRGDLTASADKFAETVVSSTPKLADVIHRDWALFAEQFPHYFDCLIGNQNGEDYYVGQLEINEVLCSRFTTVPKSFTAVRPIDVQATLNIFFQLGAGAKLRSSLRKRRDVNLDTQADVNRFRVETDSTCSTIDLSSASDHISHNLIVDLVPPDWLGILDLLRTTHTELPDGSKVTLQKWSAMGNGYTFELETIIFKAIAEECVFQVCGPGLESQVLTFGDDIIVPETCGALVCDVLQDLGFPLNLEKTFLTGRFKESCGVDVYYTDEGPVNVRPIYLRARSLVTIDGLFNAYNTFTRALSRLDEIRGVSARLHCSSAVMDRCADLRDRLVLSRALVLSWIPSQLRLAGPAYLGDVVIHVPRDEWSTMGVTPRENKRGTTSIRTWAFTPSCKRLEDYPPAVQMCVALYQTGPGQGVSYTAAHLDKPVVRFIGNDDGDHMTPYRGTGSYSVRSVVVVIDSDLIGPVY